MMQAQLLEADHRELDLIYREAVNALSSGDAVDALARVDLFWARLAVHIRAEHLRVFPAVPPTPQNDHVISRLRCDHNEFMTALADAVRLLRGPITLTSLSEARAAVLQLGERLAEHNRLEEVTVYREADTHLTHAQKADLALSIDAELKNLPPRLFAHGS
jgi:hypothetical protein